MKKWYQLALLNLVVLTLLGLLLRYKINFPLPLLQQENILHAHSHFAFNGWISFLLQLLLLDEFTNNYKQATRFWDRFFLASTFINYAMIISFAWTGYSAISIAFSTLALFLSYIFAYKIYRQLPVKDAQQVSSRFVKASLFFLLLSSFGTYALAAVMSMKTDPYWLHNALYFFLHFQYNGWFTFAVLAFLLKKLEASTNYHYPSARTFFLLLASTCIPSYLFTSLWHHRPAYITIVIIVTAILQTASLYFLWKLLHRNVKQVYYGLPIVCKWLFSIAISAFVLKVLLQFFSVHPKLAQLAFGFRPIIIGYLHLIFLGFITMYLLGVIADKQIVYLKHRVTVAGLVTFAAGILINEILLAVQGFAAIYYLYLPMVNLLLYANTFTLVAGAVLLFAAAIKANEATSKSIDNTLTNTKWIPLNY